MVDQIVEAAGASLFQYQDGSGYDAVTGIWADESGNGRAMSPNGANFPAATTLNGRSAVEWGLSVDMRLRSDAPNSDYTVLHDGTADVYIYSIIEPDFAQGSGDFFTNAAGTTSNGWRCGMTSTTNIFANLNKGAAPVSMAAGAGPATGLCLVEFWQDGVEGGANLYNADQSGDVDVQTLMTPLSTSDPTAPLYMGGYTGGSSATRFGGKQSALIILVDPTDDQKRDVENLIRDGYLSLDIGIDDAAVAWYGYENLGSEAGGAMLDLSYSNPDRVIYGIDLEDTTNKGSVRAPATVGQGYDQELTVSFWYKYGGPDSNARMVCKNANDENTWATPWLDFAVVPTSGNDGFISVVRGKSNVEVDTGALVVGQWYHITVVADAAGVYFYVDGLLSNQVFDSGTITKNTDGPWWIGSFRTLQDSGAADEVGFGEYRAVRVFYSAKDATWVANDYNRGVPGETAPVALEGSWAASSYSGTTLSDLSGNGRDIETTSALTVTEQAGHDAIETSSSHANFSLPRGSVEDMTFVFAFQFKQSGGKRTILGGGLAHYLKIDTSSNVGRLLLKAGVLHSEQAIDTDLVDGDWAAIGVSFSGNSVDVNVYNLTDDTQNAFKYIAGCDPFSSVRLFSGFIGEHLDSYVWAVRYVDRHLNDDLLGELVQKMADDYPPAAAAGIVTDMEEYPTPGSPTGAYFGASAGSYTITQGTHFTTDGSGTGLVIDVECDGTGITFTAVNDGGTGHAIGDQITGSGAQPWGGSELLAYTLDVLTVS